LQSSAGFSTRQQLREREISYLKQCGCQLAKHYQALCEHLPGDSRTTLSKIIGELRALRENVTAYAPPSETDRQLLRQLHWMAYNSHTASTQ
jgi:hypothetical protein